MQKVSPSFDLLSKYQHGKEQVGFTAHHVDDGLCNGMGAGRKDQDEEPVEEVKVEDIDESELSIEDSEKELIHKALTKANGNRKEAAARLGFSERTLYRKIKEYGL